MLNIILLLIPLTTKTIKFEVSDDFIMNLIASGGYTKEPSPFIMFMHPILGQIISFLYKIFPNVNWYTFFHISIIFICFVIIDILFLRRKNKISFFLFLIIPTIFSLDMYQLIQFTKTSALCVITGALLFFSYLNDNKDDKKSIVLSILFTCIGFMIRQQCFYLVSAIFFIQSIVFLIKKKQKNYVVKELKYIFILFFCLISLGAYSIWFDNINVEYKDYKSFGEARSQLLDYSVPPYEAISQQLKEISITKNDYESLVTWNFIDSEYYTTERITKVLNIVDEFRDEHQKSIKDVLSELFHREYWNYFGLWACLIVFILFIVNDIRLLPIELLIASLGIIILIFLCFSGRIVYRVEFVVFMSVCLAMTVSDSASPQENINNYYLVLLGVICALFCVGIKGYWSLPKNKEDRYQIMYNSWSNDLNKYNLTFNNEELFELKKLFKDNTNNKYYLGFQTSIQTYYLSFNPLKPIDVNSFKNVVYLTGVDTNNPAKNEFLKDNGISNLIYELLDNNAYLVENIYQNQILEYIQNHYDKDVDMDLVEIKDGFKIWKFDI